MRIMACLFTLLGGLAAPHLGSGQVVDSAAASLVDLFDLDEMDEAEAARLSDLFSELIDNPIELNSARIGDLERIPTMTPALAAAIVAKRDRTGAFGHLEDLLLIEGIDDALLLRIRAFVRVSRPDDGGPGRRPVTLRIANRLTRRLDLGKGYTRRDGGTRYLGGPEKLFSRIDVRYGSLVELSLAHENDAGEPIRWQPSEAYFGLDHTTGGLAIHPHRSASAYLGDYVVSAGRGLVMGRSGPTAASNGYAGSVRVRHRVRTHASTDENAFLRGTALSLRGPRQLSMTVFASRRRVDAAVDTVAVVSSLETVSVFGTLGGSGYHRTPAELARRRLARESVAGLILEQASSLHVVGITGFVSRVDLPAGTASAPPLPAGGSPLSPAVVSRMASVYALLLPGDFAVFAEGAATDLAESAVLAGVHASFGRTASATIGARLVTSGFADRPSVLASTGAGSSDENGVHLGVVLHPHPDWSLTGTVAQPRFPWIRHGVPWPASGLEMGLRIDGRPRPWLGIQVRFRQSVAEVGHNLATDDGRRVRVVRPERRRSLRGHFAYTFSDRLATRSRVEVMSSGSPAGSVSTGFALYQELDFRLTRRLAITARWMHFETEGSGARLYAYEYDVRNAFSIASFASTGRRSYVLVTFETGGLLLQARFASTRYEHDAVVGSGLDEVAGNRIREFKIQSVLRFGSGSRGTGRR